MKFKKIIPFICCLAIAGGMLAGCGSKENETTDKSSAVSESVSEETSEETSEASEGTSADAEDATEINTHSEYAKIDPDAELQTDFLSGKIELVSTGGRIADGYRKDIVAPNIDALSFRGTWAKEGSDAETPLSATDVTIDTNFTLSGSESEGKMAVLPDTMVFCLSDLGYSTDTYKDCAINAGCRLADFTYGDGEGGTFYAVLPYKISGTSLGVGFYDSAENDSAVLIQELDYKVEWTGWKLTLSYGDESVTYVPINTLTGTDKFTVKGGDLVSGYEPVSSITAIYPNANTPFVEFDNSTSVQAEFHFQEDGSLIITLADGELLSFTYRYSGETLTLIDKDNHVALYSE